MKKLITATLMSGFSMLSNVYAQPANDNPCNATSLTVGESCSFTQYTTAGATGTTGVPAPGCASYSGGDVWFSAVVPANGTLTVDTQTGVITDSGMAFYTGTCGSLTLLECDDDDSDNGLMSSITRTGLTPGATIWIRFWEYGGDNNGTFSICASSPSAATSTSCGTPINLPCGTSSLAGTTAGTTDVPHGTGCSMSNYGTWYSFVGNGQSTTISVLPQSGFDPELSIATGTCGALTNIACLDNSSSGGVESYTFQTTPGVTYYAYVAYFGSGNTTGNFTISRNCSDPPEITVPGGVVCDDAEPFCSGSYMFPNTTGGTYAQTGPDYACLGSGTPNPIWYYMEIETGGTMQMLIEQVNNSGSGIDVDFAMWGPFTSHENACNNIENATAVPIQSSFSTSSTEVVGLGLPGGSNSICSAGNGATTPPAAIAGQLYVVMITNWNGSQGFITFSQTGGTATTNCSIVELGGDITSFVANYYASKRANVLKWAVEHEMNVSHYELKRSTDGEMWTTIKTVPSKGVFDSDKQYIESDSDFSAGLNYYQVHAVDFNGATKKSEIMILDNSHGAKGQNLVKMVNSFGQEVNEDYNGLIIYIYSDGTTVKKYNNKK